MSQDQLHFTASGYHGAGFQNVVAVDPFGSGLILSGGDVAGFHRSTDHGRTWRIANRGLSSNETRIATIEFSRNMPGKVYAGAGGKLSGGEGSAEIGGGFFVSEDGGSTWRCASRQPYFYPGDARGQNPPADIPELQFEHPRATGRLICLDEQNGWIYAAATRTGLMRSRDDGSTWESIGLENRSLRGIVADWRDPGVLYVAAYNEGVWRISDAGSDSPKLEPLTGGMDYPDELLFLQDTLYTVGYSTAIKAGRVAKYDFASKKWIELLNNTESGPWESIDGYVEDGKHVLYIGGLYPRKIGEMYECILRSPDGGATWQPLTLEPERISYEMSGPGGEVWWLSPTSPFMMMGYGKHYVAAQIQIDPTNHEHVYVAGRSGMWLTHNAGATWHPSVYGMGVTMSRVAISDPNALGRVYIGNTDWVFMYSQDRMRQSVQRKPPVGSVGYWIALDTSTSPSRVYEGTGNRDSNIDGELFSIDDPLSSEPWKNEGLGNATGNKRCVAVAVRNPSFPIAADDFQRQSKDGWGMARTGGDWQLIGGSKANVVDGRARVSLKADTSFIAFPIDAMAENVRGLCLLETPAANGEMGAVVRASDESGYAFLIDFFQGDLRLRIERVGEDGIVLAERELPFSKEANQRFWIRYEATGAPALLKMRAWADGENEPANWMLQAHDDTDEEPLPGQVIGITAAFTEPQTLICHRFLVDAIPAEPAREPIMLAAVDEGGIWRKANGQWSNVNTEACSAYRGDRPELLYAKSVTMDWPRGSDLVYLYDCKSGLWRSNDQGASWKRIWTKTGAPSWTGYVMADPADASLIFVSLADGLYRIRDAHQGTVEDGTLRPEKMPIQDNGALAVDAYGNWYVSTIDLNGAVPNFYCSRDRGESWLAVGDEFYQCGGGATSSITVSPEGYVYCSTNGYGVFVGRWA